MLMSLPTDGWCLILLLEVLVALCLKSLVPEQQNTLFEIDGQSAVCPPTVQCLRNKLRTKYNAVFSEDVHSNDILRFYRRVNETF